MAYDINTFEQLGRVARIKAFEGATKLTIATNARVRNEDGEWTQNSRFVTVTVFAEKTRKYLADFVQVGDMVGCRGFIAESSYEKGGDTVYTVDLIARKVGLVASKREKSDKS